MAAERKNKTRISVIFLAILLVLVFSGILPVFYGQNYVYAGPGDSAAAAGASLAKDLDLNPIPEWVESIGKAIASFLLRIGGFFLWLSSQVLTITINETVIRMAERVKNLRALTDAWRTLRDLANMFFIFILLYIAIATILRLDSVNTKKLLVHVVVIALLINFSLFFTKVIVDVSNIVALQFHNGIAGAGGEHGLSGAFMQPLGLTTFYGTENSQGLLSKTKGFGPLLTLGLLGLVLFSVVGTVFLAAAILLVVRFVVLIFLMVLSPLAFVAMALPKDEWSAKWWKALLSQAIFAPALFGLFFVALKVTQGLTAGLVSGNAAFTALVSGAEQTGAISLLLNFMIIIGLAVFSILVAKELGVQGAGYAIKTAKRATRAFYAPITYPARGAALGTARFMVGRPARWADEKLRQTKLGQMPVLSSIREGTVGALAKMKIGGASGDEGYQRAVTERSIRESISHLKEARAAVQELKNKGASAVDQQRARDEVSDIEFKIKSLRLTQDIDKTEEALARRRRAKERARKAEAEQQQPQTPSVAPPPPQQSPGSPGSPVGATFAGPYYGQPPQTPPPPKT